MVKVSKDSMEMEKHVIVVSIKIRYILKNKSVSYIIEI